MALPALGLWVITRVGAWAVAIPVGEVCTQVAKFDSRSRSFPPHLLTYSLSLISLLLLDTCQTPPQVHKQSIQCSKLLVSTPRHNNDKFPHFEMIKFDPKQQCPNLSKEKFSLQFSEFFLSVGKQVESAKACLFLSKQTRSKMSNLKCTKQFMFPSFRNIHLF